MKKLGTIEKKKCLGCEKLIIALKCARRKFCSPKCARLHRRKGNKWHWDKNEKARKSELEELALHRNTIFTGGYDNHKWILYGHNEGEIL